MSDRIVISLGDDGVADVRLNRADKLNALDAEMFEALVEAGDGLARERGVRAVVLSGEGRAFSAGLDFAGFQQTADPAARPTRQLFDRSAASPANHAQRAAWVWRELPVPVIAALHGVVYGGGLQIALAADVRLVAPDARLSVRELHWGLVPDMSGTQTLRHLVRADVARELTYTARIVERRGGGRPRPRDAHQRRGRARTRSRWRARSPRTRPTPCAPPSGSSRAPSRATSPPACASRRSSSAA